MNQFLRRHNVPEREADKLGKPIAIKEPESVINQLLKQKASDAGGVTSEFYRNVQRKKKMI